MATIITPGRKPEPPRPWYLVVRHTCPKCGCVFTLDAHDFESEIQPNQVAPWRVVATERTPNGKQVIEGSCPDCREAIRIEGRMGGLLAGGTVGGFAVR